MVLFCGFIMQHLFIDEFKNKEDGINVYGLSAVYVNNSHYSKIKSGLQENLETIRWNLEIEKKGRHTYSSTKGDTTVNIEDKISFLNNIFKLSKSGSGKSSSLKIIYAFGIFNEHASEFLMYSCLFKEVLKKLPKASDKKNGKNNIAIFLDKNNSINVSEITEIAETACNERNLYLFERCFLVDSGNLTPGIMYADHIAYCIQNIFKVKEFNDNNLPKFKELLDKWESKMITPEEKKELEKYANNYQKEGQMLNVLSSIQNMTSIIKNFIDH